MNTYNFEWWDFCPYHNPYCSQVHHCHNNPKIAVGQDGLCIFIEQNNLYISRKIDSTPKIEIGMRINKWFQYLNSPCPFSVSAIKAMDYSWQHKVPFPCYPANFPPPPPESNRHIPYCLYLPSIQIYCQRMALILQAQTITRTLKLYDSLYCSKLWLFSSLFIMNDS